MTEEQLKKMKWSLFILPLVTLLLAAHPESVVIRTVTETETLVTYYSHFSMAAITTGHIGSGITLMCILGLIYWAYLYVFKNVEEHLVRIEAASGLGTVATMTNLFFGEATFFGTAIMVVLLAEMVIALKLNQATKEN